MPRDDKTPRKKSEGGKKKRGGSKKNADRNATVPDTPEDLDEGQQKPTWLSDAEMEAWVSDLGGPSSEADGASPGESTLFGEEAFESCSPDVDVPKTAPPAAPATAPGTSSYLGSLAAMRPSIDYFVRICSRPSTLSVSSAPAPAASDAAAVAPTAAAPPSHEPFRVGEHGFAMNPYFKDGTRLRIDPKLKSEFSDQFILNDHEVEILEISGEGFVRIRAAGKDADDGAEGWLRETNLSRIERKAGLVGVEELAQMAVDALATSEVNMRELEAQLRSELTELDEMLADRDCDLAELREELAAMEAKLAKVTHLARAPQGEDPEQLASAGATPEAQPVRAEPPYVAHQRSPRRSPMRRSGGVQGGVAEFQVGDRVYMLNPYFTDGTRLRVRPDQDADFNEHFILNDASIEIVEIENGFARVRDLDHPDAEGWVRERNLARHKRESGLAGLRRSLLEHSSFPSAAAPSAAPAADAAAAPAAAVRRPDERIESKATSSAYEAATKAQRIEERAREIAHQLKTALEKANLKTIELFRDCDEDRNGAVDKKEFQTAMLRLGVQATKEDLAAVFDRWDTSSTGTLDFKSFDHAIRSVKVVPPVETATTAKDIQKALRERMQGKKTALPPAQPPPRPPARRPAGGGREEANEKKGGAHVGQAAGRRKKEEKKAEEGEGQQWNVAQWLQSLALHDVVAATLELPEAGQKQFHFMRALERPRLEKLLNESDLISNMCDVIMEGARFLTSGGSDRGSTVANDKFQASGKFQMSYGSLSLFYGGLESLIGPPKMLKGSLLHSMEQEHTGERDARCEFTTSNGVTSTSATEWEVVINPKEETRGRFRDHGLETYPERKDFRELYPDWCRAIRPIDEMMDVMETECNARLRHEGHTELIREELVGGRLYTGPLYAKYNAVLRAKSGDAWLVEQCKLLTLGNSYTTTIHAINSCVIKLSKLTKAVKVWRGIKDAKLPKSFWVANSMGVRGGIEYGFSSTTTDKEQALHYAGAEDAHAHHLSTVFEMQMGMVDRGADLTWLSQYPHEREVLLPPLTGLEALETRVSSGMLVIQARLSLNMAAHTLEQVLSRRRKMLMDMRDGIGLELRDVLDTKLAPFSVDVLSHAMDFDALKHEPEWFNNDENFAKVMQSTLRLQHHIVKEASKLHGHLEKPEISFHKWAERGLHGSRATMLVGWVITRDANLTNPIDVALDLREASLTSEDGLVLAEAFRTIETITSIDVRGNPALEGEAVAAIVEAMKNEKPGKPRSICGVTPQNTRLEVPRNFAGASESVDTALIVAELESHFYSESVTAGMGGPVSVDVVPLNRRGGSGAAEKGGWLPLIWAAKMNHMQIGRQMIRNGTNVNVQEPAGAKSKKYTALHQACYLGHLEFAKMLLEAGADQSIQDVSGQTAKQIADKKGHTQVTKLLEGYKAPQKKRAA